MITTVIPAKSTGGPHIGKYPQYRAYWYHFGDGSKHVILMPHSIMSNGGGWWPTSADENAMMADMAHMPVDEKDAYIDAHPVQACGAVVRTCILPMGHPGKCEYAEAKS